MEKKILVLLYLLAYLLFLQDCKVIDRYVYQDENITELTKINFDEVVDDPDHFIFLYIYTTGCHFCDLILDVKKKFYFLNKK